MPTAIIADDEPALRAQLRRLLARLWPDLDIIGEAANGIEALSLAAEHQPAVAFLDIRMPGLNGLETAVRLADQCLVIFVTAYDQYAVDAFERAAVDYLLKPVTDARLRQTIERLRQRLAAEPPAVDPALAPLIRQMLQAWPNPSASGFLQWIKARQGDNLVMVPVGEVDYFQASDKYTVVRTAGAEHLVRTSISRLAEELDPSQFWRIHRKTIVNIRRIERVSRSFSGRLAVHLKGTDQTLTVSRAFAHLFKQD